VKLRFTPRATQDLIEIADYLRERNPQGAVRVRSTILACLQTLTVFPNAGRRQDAPDVRKLVTHKHGDLIYYTLAEETEEVIVLTVQHPARDRGYEDV
jgi:plasmid stabilization system protein ParE